MYNAQNKNELIDEFYEFEKKELIKRDAKNR